MNYLLTFDYELFGDGSGDLFSDVINPMQNILDICNSKNIKLTIFFEILEFIEIKKEWNKGNKMGYTNNPIISIEKQLINAYENGHDIQLHLHPQWVDSIFEDGMWKLDMNNWRLGGYIAKKGISLVKLLQKSKDELEKIVHKIDPKYSCIALRAGAYNIMPSEDIYNAMKKVGLLVDSSIYPGGYENSSLSKYDYTNVDDKMDYWYANNIDMRLKSNFTNSIIEFPIFATRVTRLRKFLNINQIILRLFKKRMKISANAKEKLNQTKISKIKYFFIKESFTWDVTVFSTLLHKKYFKYIKTNLNNRKYFVLIGHPKSLLNKKIFADFFSVCDKYDKNANFLTVVDLHKQIKNDN